MPPADSPRSAVELPARARYFLQTVIALGLAVGLYGVYQVFSEPFSPLLLILVALTVLTGMASLTRPEMPVSFSISDLFCISAALLVGPFAGAITAGLDGLVISCRMVRSKRTPDRLMFNMAAPALATWAAAEIFVWLAAGEPLRPGPIGALRLLGLMTVFGAVNFSINTWLVATVVAMQRMLPVRQIWREHFSDLWLTSFGGVFASMIMIILGRLGTLEVLILVAPLVLIIYAALRHAVGRTADHIENLGKINKVYVAAIEALAQAVDTKDQITHDHTRRVQQNSVRLARRLGVVDDAEIQAIKAAALLHDVGKIGVPEHILNKPGRLSPQEFEIMKRHAPMGAEILSVIGFPYPVVPIVRHHHENWDGTGYPDGIAGDAIPIGARVLSVVDCFDALTSDRPYRPRMTDAQALQIVRDRSGNMYDPGVVQAFFAMYAADTGTVVEPVPSDAAESAAVRVAIAAKAEPLPTDALDVLCQLGAEIAVTMRRQEIGSIVWRHMAAQLPASSCVLFAYDEERDGLVAQFRSDDRVVAAGARIALGERLSGWVAATGQSIVNSDARLDQDDAMREADPLRSALAVPIRGDARVTGVLAFYAEGRDVFTQAHREMAEAVARAITVVPAQTAALESADAA
jgi:putative nucleotidyltransferase with HDIG domain